MIKFSGRNTMTGRTQFRPAGSAHPPDNNTFLTTTTNPLADAPPARPNTKILPSLETDTELLPPPNAQSRIPRTPISKRSPSPTRCSGLPPQVSFKNIWCSCRMRKKPCGKPPD
jgi:hypothetical protein